MKYRELTRCTAFTEKHRKVLAAVLMETSEELRVVALGTGTKWISGMNLDANGQAINDCHAEVIARRAFVVFLYSELERFSCDPEGSIFTMQCHSRLLRLKSGISFHLYISQVPCGDAAVFGSVDDGPNLTSKQLQKRGRARAKIDWREAPGPPATPQVWGQIKNGFKPLYTMSCSDKLARWNLLGMQGSLLSFYLDPIYISTVTIGKEFGHAHLHRAISGRIEAITQLPRKYTVNSPKLLAGYTTSHISQKKSVDVSLNWSAGLAEVEKVNCRTGRKESLGVSETESRLCKHSLFERFLKLWDVLASLATKAEAAKVIYLKTGAHVRMATSEHLKVCLTYGEVKSLAKDYGMAKGKLLEHYASHCGGPWARKPPEQDSFYL